MQDTQDYSLIVELIPSKNQDGMIKASGSVTFSLPRTEISLGGFRVIKSPDTAPWVGFPVESYEGKDGRRRRIQLLEVSKAMKREIQEAVLHEYERQQAAAKQ